MNEESLRRANAFLAAVAGRTEPGAAIDGNPGDLGREAGLPDALAAARAVRALLARRRLEVKDGVYRLLDPRPLDPGEPEAVPRPPRRRAARAKGEAEPEPRPERTTYSEVGRVAIDKLVELSREVGSLRGTVRTAREEARQSREARDEAERRARSAQARIRDLEAKLEMAEANLRTILAAARGSGAAPGPRTDIVGDAEMEAILGVLRGGD
ncbi:MAG: hypothetical protein HY658_05610 [Actinobacteria bacterium]|nr:hypothetical protein [Actinomycetota bacterium]